MKFLQQQHLRKRSIQSLVMAKYHYYEEIETFIKGCQSNVEDSDDEEQLIDGILAAIDTEKRSHHKILVCIFEFLSLGEILRVSRSNRKMYIVSGDTRMLRQNFIRKPKKLESITQAIDIPLAVEGGGAEAPGQYVYAVRPGTMSNKKPQKKRTQVENRRL